MLFVFRAVFVFPGCPSVLESLTSFVAVCVTLLSHYLFHITCHVISISSRSWYVDGNPIRTVSAASVPGYPHKPMKVFFSIWDASQWATGPRNARIPVNYNFAVSDFVMTLFAVLSFPR